MTVDMASAQLAKIGIHNYSGNNTMYRAGETYNGNGYTVTMLTDQTVEIKRRGDIY